MSNPVDAHLVTDGDVNTLFVHKMASLGTLSAMPSVERTTASAGEVVVAHPSPAPGTVDCMSGDLGENVRRAVCGWDRSWVVYLEHPAKVKQCPREGKVAAAPTLR